MRFPTKIAVLAAMTLLLGPGCSEDSDGFNGDAEQPPEDVQDMLAWARAEGYQAWDRESEPHPSAGPHERVVVYLNPPLVDSLTSGQTHHPVGAMAVKELLTPEGDRRGWAISLKVEATEGPDPDPEAWYWFQFSDGEQQAAGAGIDPCRGCHSAGFVEGDDYVLTPFPLN